MQSRQHAVISTHDMVAVNQNITVTISLLLRLFLEGM